MSMFRAAVVTISDKGARGERVDTSGPEAVRILAGFGMAAEVVAVVPDERQEIAERLRALTASGFDLVVTTGGTGLSPRDVTPEATLDVVERLVPGVAETMRLRGLEKTPKAMLSRGVCGIRGRSLVLNLPGSPKGVREGLEAVFPTLLHGLEILTGKAAECGQG